MQQQILSTHVQQYLQLFMHWNSNVWHSVKNLRILSPRIQKWQKRNPFCRCAFVNKKLSEGGEGLKRKCSFFADIFARILATLFTKIYKCFFFEVITKKTKHKIWADFAICLRENILVLCKGRGICARSSEKIIWFFREKILYIPENLNCH